MDIVADLARPLPLTIICDLLDVPQQDRTTLASWSEPIAEAIGNSRLDADGNRAASQSMAHMLTYLRELLTRQDTPPTPHPARTADRTGREVRPGLRRTPRQLRPASDRRPRENSCATTLPYS
ncbi:hypothetical protein [Streptomyces sp. NPDC007205]|uniref:hypothetical protein n=1 Tax=Streptomyces sp. NPDC007205 TaxID=3154316 RepID=UPI0033C8AAEC